MSKLRKLVLMSATLVLFSGPFFMPTASYAQNGTNLNWTEVTAGASWDGRTNQSTLAFNGKLWVLGGSSTNGTVNDVWSSDDGKIWTEVMASADWSPRYAASAVVFDNKMWIMGGQTAGGVANDVWSSTDGTNWTLVNANPGWSTREGASAVVFDNKMWLMGGYGGVSPQAFNDVWSSSDGVNWTEATAAAGWVARKSFGAVTLDNKLWIMGGDDAVANEFNDVWSSSDGVTWAEATPSAAWDARGYFQTAVIAGKIWLLGGFAEASDPVTANERQDVWSSDDGVTWAEASTPQWEARDSFGSAILNGRIWVLGGETLTNSESNDVWESDCLANCPVGGGSLPAASPAATATPASGSSELASIVTLPATGETPAATKTIIPEITNTTTSPTPNSPVGAWLELFGGILGLGSAYFIVSNHKPH